VALTLDSGALIALERGDWLTHALVKDCVRRGQVVTVPAPVVGQVWRNGATQSRLARALKGFRVEPTSDQDARAAGVLLGNAGSSDVVDALVVLGAVRRGDEILTSDPSDLAKLVDASARRVTISVV
jgi:hypothetical protein